MRNYRQQIVIYISLIGMEGCWMVAFLLLAAAGTGDDAPSAFLLAAFFPLSFIITLLLDHIHWRRIFSLVSGWLCWAVVTMLTVKLHLYPAAAWADTAWLMSIPLSIVHVIHDFEPALLVLLSSIILWWLGKRAAQCKPDFIRLLAEFQFGLILLIIAFLIASASDVKIRGVIPLALAFFCFALTGVSTAHSRQDKSWLASMQQGHWGWLLAISICAILIIGLIIGLFVSRDLLQVAVDALKWLWGIFLRIMEFLASLMPDTGGEAALPPPAAMPGTEETETFRLFRLSEGARSVLNILMLCIWSVILILALWRVSSQIYNWLARRSARMEGVEVQQLKGAFWADMKAMFKYIGSAFTDLLKRLFHVEQKSELPGTAFIRTTYRQMIRWRLPEDIRGRQTRRLTNI
jgi:hypothetical protein